MKVLVLGNYLIAERLIIALSVDDIEVDVPQMEIPMALEGIKAQQYDLVIIDSLNENAKKVCDFFYDLDCTPVSLILSEKLEDWKTLASFKVDGFLAKEASDRELRTRIKATCRRNQMARSKA
jgi:DNA-binding response OmpR family regulator